ncbi:GNAT family N-acetyltransferase [Clostridium tyrobutyricum]|uniref:GNAT family N-acetyltransferase n=1 Tax=Clostridium tyrobutyricum TaxID=1519 RepID=UPI00073D48F6|nr:GNAT family N-acetyltransferase [Clostridium tyrobutyricum]
MLYLRKVLYSDCDLLYKWANDEKIRKNAFNSEKIKYEDHIEWFNDKIKNSSILIYILEYENIPIGQIRVNIENNAGIIDYSIEEKYRGKGFGTKLLNLFVKEIINSKLEVNKLVGQVKFNNISSQKVFEKSKYLKVEKEEYIEYSKLLK